MAAESGKPEPRVSPLVAELLATPQRFDFFQAVRVLDDDAWRAAAELLQPEQQRFIAGDRQFRGARRTAESRAHHAIVRLRSAAALGYPGAAIQAVSRRDEEGEVVTECDVTCFGLVGPSGVLPRHYTTLLVERLRRFKDRTLRDFLDILENRSLSLLYGAWAKYRHLPLIERTTLRSIGTGWDDGAGPARDPVTAVVACLVGLGTRGLSERLRVADEAVYFYAGHYAHHPRSADALEHLLSDAFDMPVTVKQFVGRWLRLEAPDQTRLPWRDEPDGWNARLGAGAIAGARVWNVQSAVELLVGPLTLARFLELLPGAPGLGRLGDMARLYVGPTIDIAIRPVLHREDVPPTRLAPRATDSSNPPALLGWTTWLVSESATADRGDAAFAVP